MVPALHAVVAFAAPHRSVLRSTSFTRPSSKRSTVTVWASPATDLDTGGYELFLYTYASPTVAGPAVGGGDSVVGGAGFDVLIGSAGNGRRRAPSSRSAAAIHAGFRRVARIAMCLLRSAAPSPAAAG